MIDPKDYLARRIASADDLVPMTDEELRLLEAEHAAEIVSLSGRLEVAGLPVAVSPGPDGVWAGRARRALRTLRLHRQWIVQEQTARKEAAKAANKARALELQQQSQRERIAQREAEALEHERNRQAKLERIREANGENARQVAVFKAVALEVLGAELYDHLWELAQRRLQPETT